MDELFDDDAFKRYYRSLIGQGIPEEMAGILTEALRAFVGPKFTLRVIQLFANAEDTALKRLTEQHRRIRTQISEADAAGVTPVKRGARGVRNFGIVFREDEPE
jgi:hypothetical protein